MKYFFKILVTLLVCVLLPCITVAMIMNYAFSGLYRETISNSQVNRLSAVGNAHDILMDTIDQSAIRLSLDANVKMLGNLGNLDTVVNGSAYPVNLSRTMTILRDLVRSSDLYESVYFYVNGSDYVISSRNGAISLDRFQDLDWMEKYAELQKDRNAVRMIPAHIVYVSGISNYDRRCLTYVHPITRFSSDFDGALIFNLYEDRILDLYTANTDDSNIAMFDISGALITGADNHDYTSILNNFDMENVFVKGSPVSGFFSSAVDGEQQLCTWYKLSDGNLVLLSIDNISTLMARQISFQFVLLILLLILIPVVSLIVLYISRRLYNPIGKLMKELRANSRLDLSGETDELSAISHSIGELLREDYRLFSDSGREKLRYAAFLRILAGEVVDGEETKHIFPYSRNICILAAPDTRKIDTGGQSFDSRVRLLTRVIQDVFTTDNSRAMAIRYEGSLIVTILSMDESIEDIKTLLIKKMPRSQGMEVMGAPVTFAVGSITDDLASIRQSFDEAKTALQYRFIKGLDSILFYDEVNKVAEYVDATEHIQYICHCLDSGKKDEALTGIHALIEDIGRRSHLSFFNVTQILNQLLSTLMQYVTDHDIHLEDLLNDKAIIYRSLWLNSTLHDAGEWLCMVFTAVIDYQNAAEYSGCEYIRRTLEYVKENYANDITIDKIADHIGISYSYLRKVFKDATGINLADYINDLRIQKAKYLLSSTGYTVKEIAVMCGYNHERSFSRSFTQAEGLSPGKYKGLIKDGKIRCDNVHYDNFKMLTSNTPR